jgi:hypothetical protein
MRILEKGFIFHGTISPIERLGAAVVSGACRGRRTKCDDEARAQKRCMCNDGVGVDRPKPQKGMQRG